MKTALALLASASVTILGAACASAPDAADTPSLAPPAATDGELTLERHAKSCSNPLPALCEICPDGKSHCAHWVHVHGKCEIEICPPPPPPPPTCPGLEHACTCVGDAGFYCLAAGAMCIAPTSPCPPPAPTCPGLEHACTCVGGSGFYCLAAGAMCIAPTSPCPP